MTPRAVAGWWIAAPAVAAMAAVAAATGKGVYVSPDAVFYVGAARNLDAGRGLTSPPGLPPIGHFPPLFALVLAAVGRLGPDPLTAARVVNVVALGAIVLLVGLVVRAPTGSVPAGLAAAVAAAAAVDLLAASSSALSEPLFILLALGGLVALAAHIDGRSLRSGRGGRLAASPRWLLLAALLVAGAFLTRYVGAALVVAGVAVLVRSGRGRRWHGALDAAVFGAVATAPVLGFLAWAGRAQGAAGDRSVGWHAFGLDYLGQAARPVARWFVPWPGPPVGLLLAVALVAAATLLVVRARQPAQPQPSPPQLSPPRSALPTLLGFFAVSYLVAVVANRLLTDVTGRLDARFLVPLHVVGILLVVPELWRRGLGRPVATVAGALVLAQVVGALAWTAGGLSDDGVARRGYTATAWRTSPVLARVAADDQSLPVYSNAFDAVELLTGTSVTPVPARKDYLTGRPNPAYDAQIAAMRAALERGGLLAYFDAATFRRSFLPSRSELEAELPLDVVLQDPVGTLYRLRPSNR